MCAIYVLYCLSSNLLFLAREGTVLVTQIAKTDSTKKQRPNLASTTEKNNRITQNFTDSQEGQSKDGGCSASSVSICQRSLDYSFGRILDHIILLVSMRNIGMSANGRLMNLRDDSGVFIIT